MSRRFMLWPGAWFIAVLISGCILALHGCAHSPIAVARDTEQRAYALYGTFVIVEEQGGKLTADPHVPQPIKAAILAADNKAKPTADSMALALQQYQRAVDSLKSGESSQAKLDIAAANLNHWIQQASDDINSLVSAVRSK